MVYEKLKNGEYSSLLKIDKEYGTQEYRLQKIAYMDDCANLEARFREDAFIDVISI